MTFWDSSAIVPLVTTEMSSRACRRWLRTDPVLVVWSLAATEVVSALARKRREGRLDRRHFATAKQRLRTLEESWHEVAQWDAVRARARRLLEGHPLRAADALHLAAALIVTEDRPAGCGFATFDERLATAAETEGFTLQSL